MNYFAFLQHREGNRRGKKSDIASDVNAHSPSSPSISNDCLGHVSSNGTYGYMYRNGTNVMPQRSLESPLTSRTCDILLDLERSSRSHSEELYAPRAPDLMTKSYHDHYDDVPWVDSRMRILQMSGTAAEDDWRQGAMLAAQVVVTCIDYQCRQLQWTLAACLVYTLYLCTAVSYIIRMLYSITEDERVYSVKPYIFH